MAVTQCQFKPGDDLIERECTPSGYTLHHVRRQVKDGGGVGLLYNSTLSVNIKDNHTEYKTFESLHAEISSNSKSLRLIVIYRPELDMTGHRVKFSLFLEEFETMISDYLLHPSEILLAGDFNIHFDTSDSNSTKFKELLSSYGLIQHINEPTHRSGHCIDFVITRDFPTPFVSNIIVNPGFSDHFSILANLNLKRPSVPKMKITTRRLKCIDYDKFRDDIVESLSNIDFANEEINSSLEVYENVLQTTLDKHAPAKTRTVKICTESPWFNDDIREARKKRRQLERKWRNNGKLEIHRLEYQNQRALVKNMIQNAKIEYYSSQVNESAGDQKKLFNVIERLLHKSKIPMLPSSASEESLAIKFADFFREKIEKIRKTFNITSVCTTSNPSYSSIPKLNSFETYKL